MHLTHQNIRLPKRLAPVVFALIMSVTIGSLMSAIITSVNTGFDDGFLGRWLTAFGFSFSLAFPSTTLIAPIVRRFVDRITH
jgi:hypothetical protein